MYIVRLLGLLPAMCFLLGTARSATDAREIYRLAAPSVVLIRTFDSGNVPLAIGSGFFLPDGRLMTNAHVIAEAARIEYSVRDRDFVPVTQIAGIDEGRDLALLVAEGPALKIALTMPTVGEPIFAIGNPQGLTLTISDGIVSAVRQLDDVAVIQITAPISPGSSGGPVLNTSGDVIGVASFYRIGGQNLNFAVSSTHFKGVAWTSGPKPIQDRVKVAVKADKRGQGRVDVVRLERSYPFLNPSISLRNNEDYPVSEIRVRVLMYADTAEELRILKAKLAALERSSSRVGSKTAEIEKLLRILRNDPRSWNASDVAVVKQYNGPGSTNLGVYGAALLIAAGSNHSAFLSMVQVGIAEALPVAQEQLEAAKAAESNAVAKAVSDAAEGDRLRAQIEELDKQKPELLHYQDADVRETIAPQMAKTVDLREIKNWPRSGMEIRVVDYSIKR